jgi:hypothetical protein
VTEPEAELIERRAIGALSAAPSVKRPIQDPSASRRPEKETTIGLSG